MPRGHVLTRRVAMGRLIVKEDVRAEGLEYRAFFHPPPRNTASSIRTPQARRVWITRLWVGALRAVTKAVRMGLSCGLLSR